MKKIKLAQGKYALVDDKDFERINQHKWCIYKKGNNCYAVRQIRDHNISHNIFMHREILGNLVDDKITHHKNNNGLDNRRKNIIPCEIYENTRAMRKSIHKKTSIFKGVSWHEFSKLWRVQIVTERGGNTGIQKYFKNEIDAAKFYNKLAKKYYGEFVYLNPV